MTIGLHLLLVNIKRVGYEWLLNFSYDLIISFLKEKPWYTVIGAPFGIGKTFLASTIARKYLEDPNNEDNYIPIFVSLKGKLENIDEYQNSLDDKLRLIAGEGKGERRKILIVCDGLDEYGEDESKLMDILRKKVRILPT
jgi:hypothetical protein